MRGTIIVMLSYSVRNVMHAAAVQFMIYNQNIMYRPHWRVATASGSYIIILLKSLMQ